MEERHIHTQFRFILFVPAAGVSGSGFSDSTDLNFSGRRPLWPVLSAPTRTTGSIIDLAALERFAQNVNWTPKVPGRPHAAPPL